MFFWQNYFFVLYLAKMFGIDIQNYIPQQIYKIVTI